MDHARLEAEVRPLRSMVEALNWAKGRSPGAAFVGVVAQDEFTHDVIVRVEPEAYVVFDTT